MSVTVEVKKDKTTKNKERYSGSEGNIDVSIYVDNSDELSKEDTLKVEVKK